MRGRTYARVLSLFGYILTRSVNFCMLEWMAEPKQDTDIASPDAPKEPGNVVPFPGTERTSENAVLQQQVAALTQRIEGLENRIAELSQSQDEERAAAAREKLATTLSGSNAYKAEEFQTRVDRMQDSSVVTDAQREVLRGGAIDYPTHESKQPYQGMAPVTAPDTVRIPNEQGSIGVGDDTKQTEASAIDTTPTGNGAASERAQSGAVVGTQAESEYKPTPPIAVGVGSNEAPSKVVAGTGTGVNEDPKRHTRRSFLAGLAGLGAVVINKNLPIGNGSGSPPSAGAQSPSEGARKLVDVLPGDDSDEKAEPPAPLPTEPKPSNQEPVSPANELRTSPEEPTSSEVGVGVHPEDELSPEDGHRVSILQTRFDENGNEANRDENNLGSRIRHDIPEFYTDSDLQIIQANEATTPENIPAEIIRRNGDIMVAHVLTNYDKLAGNYNAGIGGSERKLGNVYPSRDQILEYWKATRNGSYTGMRDLREAMHWQTPVDEANGYWVFNESGLHKFITKLEKEL